MYPKYKKDSYNSTTKRQLNLKMGNGFEQTFLQRKYDQPSHEKNHMKKMTNHHMKRCDHH